MGRDTLLKGTEGKKEKTAKKSKTTISKGKKRATPSKKVVKASTTAKKSKTKKIPRKTVKKVEKPKEIKTSQKVPETTPEIEEKETATTPVQVKDVVEKITSPATEEPVKEPVKESVKETEKEPVKEIEAEPVKETVKEPETVIARKPEKEPEKEPVVEPVKEPEKEPEKEPVVEPVKKPEKEPEKEPVVEPVKEPEKEPEKEPVVEPVIEPEGIMSGIQKLGINGPWIYSAGGALLLLIVLFAASFTNSNTFSFKQKGNTVELWKGYFAPMGMGQTRTFSDLQLPVDEEGKTIIKDTYARQEAYAILFQHFLSKADETMSRQEIPDLNKINALLKEAREYAFTDNAKKTVSLRKNGLRFLVLMGKVNLALARNTEEDLIAANEHLAELNWVATTPIQRQMTRQKAAAIESALSKIGAEEKE